MPCTRQWIEGLSLTSIRHSSIITILLLAAAVWTVGCGEPAGPASDAGGDSADPTPSPTVVPTATPTPSPTVVPTATPTPSPTVVAFPTPDPLPTPPLWLQRFQSAHLYHNDTCRGALEDWRLIGSHTAGFLDWADDGSLLVFDFGAKIAIVDTFGTDARIVADGNPGKRRLAGHHADVSPDGSRIVYVTCEFPFPYDGYGYPPGQELAIVNVDGTGLQRLTVDGHFVAYPAWSPDGSRIAFVRTVRKHLYALDPRGYSSFGAQIEVLSARGTRAFGRTRGVGLYPPVWSPDGNRLAWLVNQRMEGEEDRVYPTKPNEHILFWVHLDGSGGSRLGEATTLPTWSPDGERLAFGLEDEVYTVRLDGTDRRLVVDDLRANQVSWSPDGAELLLASDSGVSVVGADGSGLRKLGPSNLGVKSAIWSSDGSTIAARHELDDESLVFTMNRDGTDVRFLAEGTRPLFHQPPDSAICSAGVVVPEPEANPGLVEDCRVLVRVWDHAVAPERAPGWDWHADKPMAEWLGVDVHGDPPRVRVLWLPRGLLTFIPPVLGDLTMLEELWLNSNDLTGPIPSELGDLTLLKELNLSSNNLTGPIPPALGDLTMLERLDLSDNELTGPVPPALGDLTMLERLDLSNNGLTGPIPPELGDLSRLGALSLQYNKLTGPIPPELGNLTVLKALTLSNNRLTGPIPPELGNLTVLKALTLSNNRLTGPIPPELGNLTILKDMYLSNNYLTGCIPPSAPLEVTSQDEGKRRLERCKPEGEDGS